MAAQAGAVQEAPSSEMQMHLDTWHMFTSMLKLGLGGIIVLVILMALFLL